MTRGLKTLHAPLPLTRRLMRVLGAIIEIPMLAMFHPGENFALGRPIALEFVSDDHAWDIGQALEQLTKELLCRPLIPPTLDQNIQAVPLLIYGPPQIVPFTLDRRGSVPVQLMGGVKSLGFAQ